MDQAGLLNSDNIEAGPIDFSNEEIHEGELVSLADNLIYSIIIPGQFGIDVPFELYIRNLGFFICFIYSI
jgi:hypothetical protein